MKTTLKAMPKRIGALFSAGAIALIGLIAATPTANAAEVIGLGNESPFYTQESLSFERVSTDANWRNQYHYAPQFQPVENQCANVGHGNWARVNCWTDDGKNLIVRVEFLHPRVKPVAVYIKDDTAHTPTGGEVRMFDGRNKRFFEIPAENRTAAGNPYIVFNYEYFEGQGFWIEAVDNLNDRWADFTLSVTQNVNRASDADPVVARQATVYSSNFFHLSSPLSFDGYYLNNGKLQAKYSMTNANAAEAELINQIEIWPVDATTYTWRPESEDGTWAPYVEMPTRGMGCDARNIDVPRVSKMGVQPLVYSVGSVDYPIIREDETSSIFVDVENGWDRFQYETWMNGCANPFGRPGQMRPYQGQLTLPPFSLIDVTKVIAGNVTDRVSSAQAFGGTISYENGQYVDEFTDPSGWTGASWNGNSTYTYSANTIDWGTTNTSDWDARESLKWESPLLPANATVTVAENTPPATKVQDLGELTKYIKPVNWATDTPGSVSLEKLSVSEINAGITFPEALKRGEITKPLNYANTVAVSCLTEEEFDAAETKTATSSVKKGQSSVELATVVNTLTLPECPDPEVKFDKSGVQVDDFNNNGELDPGDTIRYTFTLTNTGNIDFNISGFVDEKLGLSGAELYGEDLNLNPDESISFDAPEKYVVTEADAKAGKIVNVAITTGTFEGQDTPTDLDDTVEFPVKQPTPPVKKPLKALPRTGVETGIAAGSALALLGLGTALVMSRRKSDQ